MSGTGFETVVEIPIGVRGASAAEAGSSGKGRNFIMVDERSAYQNIQEAFNSFLIKTVTTYRQPV